MHISMLELAREIFASFLLSAYPAQGWMLEHEQSLDTFSLAIMWAISKDASTFWHFCRWQVAKTLDHYWQSWSSCLWKSLAVFEKKPKVYLDDQGVLFEDEAAEGLVYKHRCSEFQNTSCVVVQLDHNSLWYCCCNLSGGVALIVWFTTNGMCVKNNTIMYVARTSINRVNSSGDLYCCLLPQCEALRTCHSGFPIATVSIEPYFI